MTDRRELVESALDNFPEGVAIVGLEGLLTFWNRAAESITGYTSAELIGRPAPEPLVPLLTADAHTGNSELGVLPTLGRGALSRVRHKLGHDVTAMARSLILHDGLGGRIGSAVLFHPADSLSALPHGDTSGGEGVEASQAELEDRLVQLFEELHRGGQQFGVLWIAVDQAGSLRKTHGRKACQSMLDLVQRAFLSGLRPSERIGRWGDDEFLVISHEPSEEMLAAHGQTLAGLARTADFRWWGDRVSVTVSIGAAQAEVEGTLSQLLGRAQAAMLSSIHAGGNHVTSAQRGQKCSQS